jgi:hypothetical protein
VVLRGKIVTVSKFICTALEVDPCFGVGKTLEMPCLGLLNKSAL